MARALQRRGISVLKNPMHGRCNGLSNTCAAGCLTPPGSAMRHRSRMRQTRSGWTVPKPRARLGWRPRWNLQTALGDDTGMASGLATGLGHGRHQPATDSGIRGGSRPGMSTRFDILETPLAGLQVLQRKPLGDSRGYLERLFCAEELQALAAGKHIAQINHTFTAKPRHRARPALPATAPCRDQVRQLPAW